jgi:predicted DNA-binding transcriptional regulator AlpA
MIQLEPLFTIDELSNEIGINKYTLYKKIREKKFPEGIKINGKRKWKPEEIKNYYNQLGIEVEVIKELN